MTGKPANRLIVPINGSVGKIEKAFNVRMNNYKHPTENRIFYSPDREPSLNLSVPVAHVAGLNNFSICTTTFHKNSGASFNISSDQPDYWVTICSSYRVQQLTKGRHNS